MMKKRILAGLPGWSERNRLFPRRPGLAEANRDAKFFKMYVLK